MQPAHHTASGRFARTALLHDLQLQNTGVNPYKFGLIGSTDSPHCRPSESNYFGKLAVDTRFRERQSTSFPRRQASASGVAAFGQRRTRAIAAAFVRKEVYATSGPRISLRVFGG
jgi:hypothetical protein